MSDVCRGSVDGLSQEDPSICSSEVEDEDGVSSLGAVISGEMASESFVLRGREDSLVLNPADWRSIAAFPTRRAAREYRASIIDSIPSSDRPIRVTPYRPMSRDGDLPLRMMGDHVGEPETCVVLRRWPAHEGGGVIALMPDIHEPNGCVLSYEHVGQHGAASRCVVDHTRPVDPSDDDAQALVRELTAIGYRVRLVRRLRGAL